jgi:hypothetical protein
MLHTQIEVRKNGKKTTDWDIVHNLDEIGLDIMAAFDNYVARSKSPRIELFCIYVKSKDPENIICLTKQRYDQICAEVKAEEN